ncbi:hypothetical protein MG293_001683 [Ovis ammon polii]|nr:hypothetical protein MG293_001683 [Ovis ammon polii]
MVNPGSSSQPPPVTAGSLSWKRCAGCGGKIADRFLLYAMDSYWHSRCLKCSCCQAQLGDIGTSCYTKSGMILCRNDYIRLFGNSGACSACGQSIPASELVMRAQGNVYHLKCFTCSTCRNRLVPGDRFHYINGSLFCEHDRPTALINGHLNSLQSNPLLPDQKVFGASPKEQKSGLNHQRDRGMDLEIGKRIREEKKISKKLRSSDKSEIPNGAGVTADLLDSGLHIVNEIAEVCLLPYDIRKSIAILHSGCVRLFATPWTIDRQASLSMGLSKQEYLSKQEHFIFPFHVKPKILLFLNFPTGRSEALKARHLDEKRVVLVDHLLVLQLYKQKIENALETMFQSYYISKEFAFKDQKNNNMEMKPSACTKEWIFGLFFPLLLSPSEAYLVLWEKLSSFALEIYRLERMPKKVRNYQQKILDQLKYLSGLPMLYSGKSLEKLLCVAQPVHAVAYGLESKLLLLLSCISRVRLCATHGQQPPRLLCPLKTFVQYTVVSMLEAYKRSSFKILTGDLPNPGIETVLAGESGLRKGAKGHMGFQIGEGKFGRVKFVLNGFIGGNKAKRGCSKPSDISYGGLVSSFGGSGHMEQICLINGRDSSDVHNISEQQCDKKKTKNVKGLRMVAKLCPTLFDPKDYSLPGSSVHGISQWIDPMMQIYARLADAAAAESLQSCPTLCDPIDGSPRGSPIPGILQARTLE